MKKQPLLYGLTLTGLAIGSYIEYKIAQNRSTFLEKIVQRAKNAYPLQGVTYIGSWRILPETSADPSRFHFGFNYQDNNGNLEVQAFWADSQTGKIIRYETTRP
ncbi:hypothetical protein KTE19_03560 [Lentilactobacillus sp. IMAU92037]|uniref:hypothetical protein n=1 Tax=Lentilactobacillus TaxID=2767893 RepID=UPI001C252CE1|nr:MULTISPECIES: hypothetical protein [Lentilactobacillus]MBU9789187.1 hypothetical protein [Lentilactobacillus dabitei]MBV0929800.1 hypothetical protein [Lentilactobacillus dabitei]MDM7515618.1 hypothetical protein [Lentilactobacillus sp. TOM.63]